ncbi:innexin inx7 [Bacillus rossius redtenbacheri]|uniref:innexin inx7 n=1 Tax=Bacillus rossius redtenbacheri TaxID=93214 RepID=UPI002FDE2872
MLQTFGVLARHVPLTPKKVAIDNPVFRLHYRATVLLLLACTVLVSSQQYVGEHIRCMADGGLPEHVVNTYCFFAATFTVMNASAETGAALPGQPGVGPWSGDGETQPVVRHAYYQWVPFLLFLQALLFYAPHAAWKRAEGGRLAALVAGLELAPLASQQHQVRAGATHVPSLGERDAQVAAVRAAFLLRLHVNRPWASWLVACELLNAVNLAAQAWALDAFLGGRFADLGPRWIRSGGSEIDLVFPKMTKCLFHKFGPSGSVQNYDVLCVMALNIVNEKIYAFLWFWMWLLAAATAAGLLWRLLTFFLHSRSVGFNRAAFRLAASSGATRDAWSLVTVTRECHFADWLFLYYLAKNMDGFVFRDLFLGLAREMDDAGKKSSPLAEPNHNDGGDQVLLT